MNELSPVIKIFLSGWIILLVAIAINAIVNSTPLSGWYAYLGSIGEKGLSETHKDISVINLIFLYLVYPFLLGLCAYLLRNWF
jgi:hypothetical protein